MNILRFYVGFVVLICLFYNVRSQESILSVSSFRSCVSVDSRYQVPSTANNASTLINCTTNTDTLPQITVVDMRLNPGIGTESELLFNVTVVQGNQNGAGDVPSTSPTECQLNDPTIQNCVLTTPAVVHVKATNIVYRYKLTNPGITIPYCYGSVSIFEQYRNSAQKCQDLCDGVLYDCANFTGCIPIQYASDSMLTMIYKKINVLQQQANTDQFKLNAFKRVQEPVNFSPIICTNFNSKDINLVMEYGEICQDVFGQPSVFTDGDYSGIVAKQGNLRNIENGWFNNGIYNKQTCIFSNPEPKPIGNKCRESMSNNNTILYDNSNYDVRIPTFMPNPSIYGATPNPIYRNLITLPISSANDINLPVNVTSISLDLGSVGFACAGYDCPANQDVRRVEQPAESVGGADSFSSPFFNTINSIVSLGPQCYVYYVTPEPEVFAEVTIEVTANGHTETLTIDNFNPSGSSTSGPFRYVFGRIENIQTPTGIVGPSIQGAIIVCGQDADKQFINMQCLIEGVNCNSDQTVDVANSPDFSEVINPWQSIKQTSLNQNGFTERTKFYPHPYDYIIPSTENGKNLGAKSLPNDHGQTFWFFVNNADLATQFGVDCNKVGMAQGVNSVQQNANLFCNLEPHSCTPGLGTTVNGGLKNSVPCKVSQFMNFASGFYDKTTIPFPYGGTTQAESDAFIQSMKDNAIQFMPNNPFLAQGNNGTNSLYDPSNPQWWLGYGGQNSGGQFLYFSPTTTNGTQYNTNIAVELVLDVVGTFVGYEAEVSKGVLDPTLSICEFVQGQTSHLAIYASNPSLEGVGVTTSYIITVDCNPPGQNIGFSMDTEPNSQQITLAPGENQYVNFTTIASTGNPGANQVGCIATMLYADVVVNASCSQVSIDCGIKVQIPDGSFSDGDVTPPPPEGIVINCTGFCDLTCYIEKGTPWQSGCFWLAVILPIILGLGCVGTLIGVLYLYCYKVGENETSVKRSNDFVKSQEKRSQEIINPSLDKSVK